jgi:hypothetical protein
MKQIFILFLVVFIACTPAVQKKLPAPNDSTVIALIKETYTADNQLDGSEFATVDSVVIKEKIVDAQTCIVKFHIDCSYQPAAMSPGFEQQRPALNADTSITLVYNKDKWEVGQAESQ